MRTRPLIWASTNKSWYWYLMIPACNSFQYPHQNLAEPRKYKETTTLLKMLNYIWCQCQCSIKPKSCWRNDFYPRFGPCSSRGYKKDTSWKKRRWSSDLMPGIWSLTCIKGRNFSITEKRSIPHCKTFERNIHPWIFLGIRHGVPYPRGYQFPRQLEDHTPPWTVIWAPLVLTSYTSIKPPL